MGSAAPSVRRWLSVTLLVAAVVSFVALRPGSDQVDLPALGSQVYESTEPGRPPAVTVTVALAAGHRVPAMAVPAIATDPESSGGSAVSLLKPGAKTVGAAVSVIDGARSFVVHGAGQRHLAYRIGIDGDWDGWRELSTGGEESPDGLAGEEGAMSRQSAAAPVLLSDASSDVEFVVIGGDKTGFDLTFVGTVTNEATPNPASAVIGDGVLAQAGSPTIIGRDQWATFDWDYQNDACDEGPSVAEHVSAVVVHHTVTANNYSEADVVDLLRSIHYSHVVINGWCDIGYNFVVDRFGRIWEARTGSIDKAIVGGHARGFNTSTVGVAILGQHHPGARPSVADVSDAAEAAVETVSHWKLGSHGVDPGGMTWLRNRASSPPLRLAGESWHYLPTVVGHRDLGVTSCPGGHGADLVRKLPARLSARRDVSLPYTFVDWQAYSHGPGFVIADRIGGVRPAGTASPWPQAPAGLPGGESVIAVGGDMNGGYLLSSAGLLVGYGSAPAQSGFGPVSGAVDLVVRRDARSGWVVDGAGTLHGFGGVGSVAPSGQVANAVAAAVTEEGTGYVLDVFGGLHPVGGAAATGTAGNPAGGVDAVDLDIDQNHSGEPRGWVLDRAGRLHGFGGAPSTRVTPLQAVVSVAADGSGQGGWVLDTDGQLWPFGGARLIFPVSTNAAAGHAVDLANVGSLYSPDFAIGPDARFIEAVYELFLGRESSLAETDIEVAALEQGDRRIELTARLATSEQWAGATLDQMYADVLGRAPDTEGRAYWLAEISRGLTLQDLGTYFYGSEEYASGAGSNEAYVRSLYQLLLHRQPDQDGLNYWVGLLDGGRSSPPDVANSFYASIESRRDRARSLHRRILDSDPSTDATEALAERLLTAGDAGVAAELAADSEFYHLAVNGPDP